MTTEQPSVRHSISPATSISSLSFHTGPNREVHRAVLPRLASRPACPSSPCQNPCLAFARARFTTFTLLHLTQPSPSSLLIMNDSLSAPSSLSWAGRTEGERESSTTDSKSGGGNRPARLRDDLLRLCVVVPFVLSRSRGPRAASPAPYRLVSSLSFEASSSQLSPPLDMATSSPAPLRRRSSLPSRPCSVSYGKPGDPPSSPLVATASEPASDDHAGTVKDGGTPRSDPLELEDHDQGSVEDGGIASQSQQLGLREAPALS